MQYRVKVDDKRYSVVLRSRIRVWKLKRRVRRLIRMKPVVSYALTVLQPVNSTHKGINQSSQMYGSCAWYSHVITKTNRLRLAADGCASSSKSHHILRWPHAHVSRLLPHGGNRIAQARVVYITRRQLTLVITLTAARDECGTIDDVFVVQWRHTFCHPIIRFVSQQERMIFSPESNNLCGWDTSACLILEHANYVFVHITTIMCG